VVSWWFGGQLVVSWSVGGLVVSWWFRGQLVVSFFVKKHQLLVARNFADM